VPGATVTVKNNATAVTFETVSNTAGAFSLPVLDPGTYTVTVTLSGFKTVVINDVRLLAATPGSLRATLEVGGLEETVEVKGGTDLVQTQSSTVSSTITTEQITNLPLVSRNALNFVVFLPGVETSAGPRGSTISGLPQNAISVTYDGVNVNNNFQSTDGFEGDGRGVVLDGDGGAGHDASGGVDHGPRQRRRCAALRRGAWARGHRERTRQHQPCEAAVHEVLLPFTPRCGQDDVSV